jgi:tetratricopeptide (TPR) repeat protein
MARPVNLDNPLVLWRHATRSLRSGGRLTEDPRQAALRDRIELALFRVPARQREVVKRYDLSGEPAVEIQRALGISARQFFRDRRAALTELKTLLPNLLALPTAVAPVPATPPRSLTHACDATLSGRASARSLAQTGNARCLDVLHELAANATDTTARTDLFLELAELALDFDDDNTARDAVEAVLHVRNNAGKLEAGLSEYLSGRLARAEARLTESCPDAATKLREAVAWLRRSVAANPGAVDTRAALLEALGDAAALDFEAGNFASAQAASAEAVDIIESFTLWTRPRALEIMAMDVALDACLSGRMDSAIERVSSLLRRAVDSAWSATASRLGADLVGLYSLRGESGMALRWYGRMWPTAVNSARPRDRWSLAMDAAGTYAAAGRPREALAVLSGAKDVTTCPPRCLPEKHAFVASSLLLMGANARALREARTAFRGYAARRVGRGMGDAHRLIAKSCARLGDVAAAREHIDEARRLSERYGVLEGLLCTLHAQAEILQRPKVKAEAQELERLLRSRAPF